MDPTGGGFYEFGPFRLDPGRHLLLRGGVPVPLTPKVYDTLLALVRQSGRLLTKDELLKTVWPDTIVEENNLNQSISALRRALADGQSGTTYIETVPRLGYRFLAEVRERRSAVGSADVGGRYGTVARLIFEEEEGEEERIQPVPRTAREIRSGPAVLLLLILVGGALALSLVLRRPTLPVEADARSVAVLPFQTVGPDENEHLGLGMADALITRLGNLKELVVRPTSAIDDYAGVGRDPLAAGRELRVGVVLDGRIHRVGDRVRVTVQVLNVRSGATLWSDTFDDEVKHIFALQDAIAERVAETLVPTLSGGDKGRLVGSRTESMAAYRAYVRGRVFWNKRTPDGLRQALQEFQDALDEDPAYAQAYAGLADCYNLLPEYRVLSPVEAMPRAKEAALRALEIDHNLADAHTSLAYTHANFEFDFTNAERSFRRALDLNPSYATAHQWYAEYLVAMGRFDEAVTEYRRAQMLDPLSPIASALAEYSHVLLGEHDRAIEGLRQIIALHPNFPMAHSYLAWVYERQGRHDELVLSWLEGRRLSGDGAEGLAALRRAFASGGARAFWRKELELVGQQPFRSAYYLAVMHALLGEKHQALAWLERAYKERDRFIIFMATDQRLADIKSHPRFRDLARRVGLTDVIVPPQAWR